MIRTTLLIDGRVERHVFIFLPRFQFHAVPAGEVRPSCEVTWKNAERIKIAMKWLRGAAEASFLQSLSKALTLERTLETENEHGEPNEAAIPVFP